MSRRKRTAIGAVAGVVALVAGVLLFLRTDEGQLPADEAAAFLAAWAEGDAERVAALATSGSDAAGEQAGFGRDLAITSSTFELGVVRRDGDAVSASFSAVHQLRGLGEWRVKSSIRLVREEDRWRVAWAPSALHPAAAAGSRFERERQRPERAPILGGDAQPLTVVGKVVAIGVQPSRIRDRAAAAAALQQHAGIDPARLEAALAAPGVKPDHFVPLVNLREERYGQVEAALRPVPGIVFQRHDARLTPNDGFAAHTIGRTGEVTAEQLEDLGAAYQPGDVVGRSGLELAYEKQLAGTPSGEVRLVPAGGTGTAKVLRRFTGTAPAPLATTLSPAVQRAADAALEGVTRPAAIVAVDVATGGVVAVSSRPLTEPLNRALSGRYPPGSTFKIVTTEAVIASGTVPAGGSLPCPAETTIGGRRFRNFEGESLGATSLRDAFVHSCNTAFVSAAGRIDGATLVDAASRFGFGVTYGTGLGRRTGGSFPAPRDAAERAAAAIGQARVLATPAHMASVAAAIASGTWRAPTLLAAAQQPTATPTAPAVEAIGAFMRGVVTDGTGRAARHVPGLAGKTGTAEYGSGDPLPTHAWFVGFRNRTAFSVLIEGGGVGGRDAAPVAARFAAAL